MNHSQLPQDIETFFMMLSKRGVHFLVAGDFAATCHGVRTSYDHIDVLIDKSDDNQKRAVETYSIYSNLMSELSSMDIYREWFADSQRDRLRLEFTMPKEQFDDLFSRRNEVRVGDQTFPLVSSRDLTHEHASPGNNDRRQPIEFKRTNRVVEKPTQRGRTWIDR